MPGTVLLTLADMSVIQAEVEVDETNIPNVSLGQTAKITIDAMPDRTLQGTRQRDRQQPDPGDRQPDTTRRRPRTSRSSSSLDEQIPDVRPGFTCTADITTATRNERRRGADSGGRGPRAGLRREQSDREGTERSATSGARHGRVEPVAAAAELKPGETRKETEGVFVVRDGKVEFVPIKMGISGDKYLRGAQRPESRRQVVTGPYNSVRGMADGDEVKVDTTKGR